MMVSLTREPYPSRELPEPMLLRRREPVLWNDGPGPDWLPPDALERYEQDGFLVLPALLTAEEVALLQREMTALLERFAGSDSASLIREPGSDAVRSIFALPAVSEVFARLARHPKLLGFAEHVLGSQAYLHQSRLNYKPGLAGKEFYWHSDFETWHVEDGMPAMRALSCSVLLTENTEFNGPLFVIPGSHRTYVGCVGSTPEDNYKSSLMTQTVGTPAPESLSLLADQAGGLAAVKGPPGTVLFFDSNLLHGSTGNISPYARANVFMVYNSVENRLGPPQHGLRPRPEHIAHRRQVEVLRHLHEG
ncbi:MAG: Ectoine hydroxylase [Moraxellaceae bacterium]|jgi:ectoine hydroxylase|nr:Ectoine hydroxylase [Moraxellaceae bacterium]